MQSQIISRAFGNYLTSDKMHMKLFPNFTCHHLITHTYLHRVCLWLFLSLRLSRNSWWFKLTVDYDWTCTRISFSSVDQQFVPPVKTSATKVVRSNSHLLHSNEHCMPRLSLPAKGHSPLLHLKRKILYADASWCCVLFIRKVWAKSGKGA